METGDAFWDRSTLQTELENFSQAAMQHARSPRNDASDLDFATLFRDAARDLLALASPRDREFVLDALERICRIYPQCDGGAIARLRREHETADAMHAASVLRGGLTDRAAIRPA